MDYCLYVHVYHTSRISWYSSPILAVQCVIVSIWNSGKGLLLLLFLLLLLGQCSFEVLDHPLLLFLRSICQCSLVETSRGKIKRKYWEKMQCAIKRSRLLEWILSICFTFTFMHLADAFIQSDLQLHSGYTFSLVCVFPGNRTHNLLRCWRNALPLSHTGTLVALMFICLSLSGNLLWIFFKNETTSLVYFKRALTFRPGFTDGA